MATPHVAEQLSRYPKLTENKIQEMCQVSIFFIPAALNPHCNIIILSLLYCRAENGVFATSFRHLLQPSMAKLCLWETLLGFMDETTARLMEKFRNFCKLKVNVCHECSPIAKIPCTNYGYEFNILCY